MKNKTHSIRYASGLFALTLVSQLFHSFSYSYYVDTEALISLNLATIAKVIFVIVDGLNDVIWGALSEKTISKRGKRIPWLIYSLPFFPLSVTLTFLMNKSMNLSTGFFFFYYLTISLIFENLSTIQYLNYGALFPLLFKEEKERGKVSTYKHAFEVVGLGICLVLTPMLVQYIGYIGASLIYSVIFLIIMIYCIKGIRYDYSLDFQKDVKYSLKNTIKDFLTNKSIIIYHLSVSFILSSMSVLMTLYPIYAKYVLKINLFQQGILMAILFVGILSSLFIWNKLLVKFGHRKCWKISYCIFPFALASLSIPSSFLQGLITIIIVSPLIGGILITPDLMSAEIIDIDKYKNKVSREASFMSLGTLTQRVSVMFSALFMSLIGTLFGYVDGNNPGSNPELTFRIIIGALLPLIALLGSLLSIIYIKKSKKDLEEYLNSNESDKKNI